MTNLQADGANLVQLADVPISLRWRDLDAFNHVNNSVYLTYLEESRLHWLNTSAKGWDEGGVAPVMAATQLNYRRQLTWPGTVRVLLFCDRLGTSSMTVAHRIVDAENPSIVYNDGDVVMVWINSTTGKSVPLPNVIRMACAA